MLAEIQKHLKIKGINWTAPYIFSIRLDHHGAKKQGFGWEFLSLNSSHDCPNVYLLPFNADSAKKK